MKKCQQLFHSVFEKNEMKCSLFSFLVWKIFEESVRLIKFWCRILFRQTVLWQQINWKCDWKRDLGLWQSRKHPMKRVSRSSNTFSEDQSIKLTQIYQQIMFIFSFKIFGKAFEAIFVKLLVFKNVWILLEITVNGKLRKKVRWYPTVLLFPFMKLSKV